MPHNDGNALTPGSMAFAGTLTVRKEHVAVAHKDGRLENRRELTYVIHHPKLTKAGKVDHKATAQALAELYFIAREAYEEAYIKASSFETERDKYYKAWILSLRERNELTSELWRWPLKFLLPRTIRAAIK